MSVLLASVTRLRICGALRPFAHVSAWRDSYLSTRDIFTSPYLHHKPSTLRFCTIFRVPRCVPEPICVPAERDRDRGEAADLPPGRSHVLLLPQPLSNLGGCTGLVSNRPPVRTITCLQITSQIHFQGPSGLTSE